MTIRNTILSTLTVLSVLLFSNVEHASGSTVTVEIGGVLTEASGANGLAVGDPFTGTFSYSLEQLGTDVPSVQATRYVFDSYTLTLQGQTVFSTGGDVTIENNGSFGDNFTLNVDPTTPAAIVTGSINGAVGFELFLFLRALNGVPFMDTSLPPSLNLADFPDMRRIDLVFQSNRGSVIGEITNLSVVPLPAAIWLFILGLGGLSLFIWKGQERENSKRLVSCSS
jgi:hypothetical protein